MTKAANQSVRYRAFIKDRNLALEKIHHKGQMQASDVLRRSLTFAMDGIARQYLRIPKDHFFTSQAKQIIKQIEAHIENIFEGAARDILEIVYTKRRHYYLLARAGETEGIARATGKPKKVTISKNELHIQMGSPAPSGGHFYQRILLGLSRVKRDIIDAIEHSRVLEEDWIAAQSRIFKALPQIKRYKRAPIVIRHSPIKEASKPPIYTNYRNIPSLDDQDDVEQQVSLNFGFIPDDDWSDMVDDYMTDFIPKWRDPREMGEPLDVEGDEKYAWEVENEMTEDFVGQVRTGQIDAAKENGINDFMWIAVIDAKTDDCCSVRHGLTTAEIEQKLKSGAIDESDCDAVTPPAHFSCRCDLAPMLDDMPEQEPSNIGEFDDWLNNTSNP